MMCHRIFKEIEDEGEMVELLGERFEGSGVCCKGGGVTINGGGLVKMEVDVVHDKEFYEQEYSEEQVAKTMAETMKQYMSKTRAEYGSGVARPKIEDKDNFELKGQFLKELRTNTFSGLDHEDANEHIEKVLEIVDLFHILNITTDPVMLRAFPVSLTGAASHWLRNKPNGSIKTWDGLKTKFLNKYCPPA
ncbi:retrovirus-related pol polyprotein from transposon TNT 1-94 [Tanacetum coccineum]